jgi:RNA ligase (TIGR02306 family)
MRKLASIRQIASIDPIEGADAIEVATVDGWRVVVKKGEFTPGELALYLEIDSWVPHELAPFLSKGKEPREYNGVKGERLRTIKLRGQISQGLLLPLRPVFSEWSDENFQKNILDDEERIGDDLTECLGVQKWEAPIAAQLQGQARGNFPTEIAPKTDQERIQNCFPKLLRGDFTYEISMKLDGSSMTIFRHEGDLRVCSRNLELKINEDNATNSFVQMANRIGDQIPEGYVFQGELMGPGIQGNREGFKDLQFFVFDVLEITGQRYLTPPERREMVERAGLDHVPVLVTNAKAPDSVEEALSLADGPSIHNQIREGLVWKCNEKPEFSFKAISNQFLLKGGE